MTLQLESIPTIDSLGRLGRAPEGDDGLADMYHESSQTGVSLISSAGFALGQQAASLLKDRLFPPELLAALRRVDIAPEGGQALAETPNYTTYMDCGYAYDPQPGEVCWGAAPHHMDPFYCGTCEEQAADPANNPAYNWHFVGSRGEYQYWDNGLICPGPSGGRDAWKWDIGPTSQCSEKTIYRCHDGWKRYPGDTSPTFTICQGLVQCDNRLTTCD